MAIQNNFSTSKMDEIYKRNPSWSPSATTTQPAATTATTPNSATVSGGIDFSNIKPQFSMSAGTSTNNSNSYSGLSREGMNALMPLLSDGASGLSNRIDQWADQAAGKYYTKGSDIIDTMNQVANKRAQSGILGGTEAQNLRANMLGQLLDRTLGEQAKLYSQGLNLKATSVPQLLNLLQQSTSTGQAQSNNMSYGQSPQDYQIIADMIRAGWTG